MTTRPAPALARWTCDRGHEFWTRTPIATACPHIRGGKPCPGVPALAPLTDAQLRERYSGRMLHRMRRRQLDHDTAVRRIAHALGHPITHAPTTEGAQ